MNRIIFLLVAFGLVACNDEVAEDQGSSGLSFAEALDPLSHGVPWCPRFIYVDGGWQCEQSYTGSGSGSGSGTGTGTGSGAGSNSSGGGDPGGTATESSHPANIARYTEYEPNNVPENANPVAFPTVSGDAVPGIEITGAVRDVSDESDYFILSPNMSGVYAIYLCADTCTEHPTDSMVAIRVLDQFGTVIAGNPLYAESTKIVTADFDAGIPYYVQVLGFDTLDQEYQYKLVIID